MNDILYDIAGKEETLNIKELADSTGLDYLKLARAINDRAIRFKLQHDIYNGLKLNISGTPAFVINNKVYLAQIPPEIIKDVLKN
jgi:protein-disulfide isomerase